MARQKRDRFAAVMLQFKVGKRCTGRLARYVVWNNNRGDGLEVYYREEEHYGGDVLAVRLSKGYVGADRPVMISAAALQVLLTEGRCVFPETIDGAKALDRAIQAAERALK